MGYRREPIEVGEWYHCYNRGIDKRNVFDSEWDCKRFLQTLYLSNGEDTPNRKNFDHYTHEKIFSVDRGEPIVAIGAYCLMPNHFHLLLQEIVEGGISRFMHRLGTSYTMYFNEKNQRVGNLFYKPFRSRHVGTDKYFRHIPQYVHLNAAEIFDRQWQKGSKLTLRVIEDRLKKYPYSSFPDYYGASRVERRILDEDSIKLLSETIPNASAVIQDAIDYYRTLA